MKLQYFSKWRNEWVDFLKRPTKGELEEMKKYYYQTKEEQQNV